MTKRHETLVQLRKITEWKDGCINKTEAVAEVWVPVGTPDYTQGLPDLPKDHFYCPLSTKRSKELDFNTYRTREQAQ